VVAEIAGISFPDPIELDVVSSSPGGSGTDFGVPSVVTAADRQPVPAGEATRLASLVGACWDVFDRTVQAAPQELRKGPRGGGRNTSQIVGHVVEADRAYARQIGIKQSSIDPLDRPAVEQMRRGILDILALPSDGSPIAGRKWALRYAARRIAWHALDHAWEIEDRTPT
jgi:hypothetical protein